MYNKNSALYSKGMIFIKRKILISLLTFVFLFSSVTTTVSAEKTTPKSSGLGDSADYLLDVPSEGNYIYYSSDWKSHGLSWTSFKIFCKTQYNTDTFNYSDRGGYIHTKTINGENFYEAEFNNDVSAFGIIEGCNIIAIQPVQIQYDKAAFDSGENVALGNYIDTSAYTYVATRVKVESRYQKPKSVSVMLRAAGRDQYIDNMEGTFLIDNKTGKIQGPHPSLKYVELTSDFDGWIVMPVADMAEGKPLSELVTVSFFCHSEGHNDKCGHSNKSMSIENTDWTDSTLYIGDMMLVKDIETFKKVRTSCNVLGHKYGEPVVVKPTATSNGSSTVTCNVCGHKQVSQLVNSIGGKFVEGLNATVAIEGNSNIGKDVIFKANDVLSSITKKNKNKIIRGINSLSDKISGRKLAAIFDLSLITREKDKDGKNIDSAFDFTGKLNITLPIDTTITNNFKNLNLVYVAEDESAEILSSSITNGKLKFTTEKLGFFALVGGTKTDKDKETESNAQTSSANSSSKGDTSSDNNSSNITSSKEESSKDKTSKDESSKDKPSKNESSKENFSKDESSNDNNSKNESSKDSSSKDDSSADESSKDKTSKDEASKSESSKDKSSKDSSSKDKTDTLDSKNSDSTNLNESSDSSENNDSKEESTQSSTTIIVDSSDTNNNLPEKSNFPIVLVIIIAAVLVCGLGATAFFLLRKS